MSDGPAAGWYPDPKGDGLRYWDGDGWTEHTHDGDSRPSAVTTSGVSAAETVVVEPHDVAAATVRAEPEPTLRVPVLVAGLGGLVMSISLFLSWADGGGTPNAFDSDLPFPVGSGVLLLVIAVATLLAVLGYLVTEAKPLAGVAAALGLVGAILAVWAGIRFEDEAGGAGIGVWVWLVGSGMALAGGILAVTDKSSGPADSGPD